MSIKNSNKSLFKISKINSIAYYDLKKQTMDLKFDNSWIMIFTQKGNCTFLVNGKCYDARENNGYIFLANKHEIKTYENTLRSCKIFIISFSVTGIDKSIDTYTEVYSWKKDEYLLSLIAKEVKKAYMLTCGNEIRDFKLKSDVFIGAYQVISIYIEQLLISVFENKALKEKYFSQNKKNTELITKINNYLIKNTDKKLTNADICEKFNYSVSALNKLFKEYFDRTLHDHFLYLKIEAAKKILREEKITVNKISDSLCFSDSHNFSKTFKKYTGITPNDYINKIKNDWRR